MKRDKRSIKQIVNQYWPTPPKYEVEAAGQRVWSRLAAELDNHDTSLRSLYGDGWSAPALGGREFQVLSAAAWLEVQNGGGTLSEIHEAVQARAGRARPETVFMTLRRLEGRGLLRVDVQTWPRFHLTEDGERALARARAEAKSPAAVRETVPC